MSLGILAAVAAAGAMFLVTWVVLQATVGKPPIQRRLAALRQYAVQRETTKPPLITRWIAASGRLVERLPTLARHAAKVAPLLDRLGGTMRPAEWMAIRLHAAVAAAIVLPFLLPPLLGVPAGLLLGFLGANFVLRYRIKHREKVFTDELPGALQLMISSLRSGFTLHQAIEAAVRDDEGPVAVELRRALSESRISGEFEEALERIGERLNSSEMLWLVMALRLQKEVGGSLVEVMQTTADTMRERAFLHRHIRSLSGEGRISAYVLGSMPFLATGMIWFTRPQYLSPMLHQPLGWAMIGGASFSMLIGVIWLRAVVKVEV
ncbi:type II secretion system F family protein [Actinoplanes sp. NPDC051851]|uniref:type II secretion system F family protein n=1 Tax=Actinoplanes sp. NPDC051851 TaxID=3154753 RepID=UPI0034312964